MSQSTTPKTTPKGKKQKHATGNAIPLRPSDDLKALVGEGAAKLELSEEDTIRIATEVGLERLARMNWDIAAAAAAADTAKPTAPAGPPVGLGTGQRIPPSPGYHPAKDAPKPDRTPEQLDAARLQRRHDLNRLCAGRPR